jgi:hypothetical protein
MKLATQVREIFKNTPGVVDVDWYVEANQPKTRFIVDKEKASLNGISAETISQTLRIAVGGQSVDLLHIPREKEDINLVLEIPRSLKTTPKSSWESGFAPVMPTLCRNPPPPLMARLWSLCASLSPFRKKLSIKAFTTKT